MTATYVEAFGDLPVAPLGGESVLVADARVERRREFATARHCAHTALRRLGLPDGPLLADGDGVPRWPWGVVGSITHCAGYRAAAVALTGRHRLAGVGLDAEPHEPLPPGVLDLIADDAERRDLADLAAERSDVHGDRLLFCVKEAAFKATFPRTRQWREFDEVSTAIRPDGRFRAAPGGGADEVRGRWWVRRGVLLACGVTP